MILILDRPVLPEQINQLTEVYETFIKVVVDLERNLVAAGGEYHIDCEELLIADGSDLRDLFGGGIDMNKKQITYGAMTNFKPKLGYLSYDLSDQEIRSRMDQILNPLFDTILK